MADKVTVKSGDTLGKIAARLGVTLKALADANGISDVNKIRVGQMLRVPAAVPPSPPPASGPAPPPPVSGPSSHPLGKLSEKFESSGRGPGTVSSGVGDAGGISYGTFQLASKRKVPEDFLAHEGKRFAAEFKGARSGTPAFSAVWKAIAARERLAFGAAQHDFIKRTHFDVQIAHILKATRIDLDKRSDAVRDAVWSTAVQFGPSCNQVITAMKGGNPDDPTLLRAIYAERGRKKNGKLVFFPSSSPAVQRSVENRFKEELKDALAMLGH